MKRIIFTGAGGAGSEAIWRLWHDRYDLLFADADLESICPDIPVERRLAIPMAIDSRFSESLKLICQDQKVDLLIITLDKIVSSDGANGIEIIFKKSKSSYTLISSKIT